MQSSANVECSKSRGASSPPLLVSHRLTAAARQCCSSVQATPKLSEDKVKQCVEVRLNGDYPPKAVAKMAAVAALCAI